MPLLPFASLQATTRSHLAKLPSAASSDHWPESAYPAASVEPNLARISPFAWNEDEQATTAAPELTLARLLHSLEPNASIQTTHLLSECAGLLRALWDDKIWITEAASDALNHLMIKKQGVTQQNLISVTHSPDAMTAGYYLSVNLGQVMQPVNYSHLQLVTRNKQQNQSNQLLADKNSPLKAQKVQLWDVQGKGRALRWVIGVEA